MGVDLAEIGMKNNFYLHLFRYLSARKIIQNRQRKRMNAKFLFFSGIRLFNKIISAVFRRIC